MRDSNLIIKCPYCGAEYVPSEIFYPDDFLPDMEDIVRDENEQIVSYTGGLMNLEEEYCCNKCNHTFKVKAKVTFEVEKCEQHDFDFDYVAPIYSNERTELKED